MKYEIPRESTIDYNNDCYIITGNNKRILILPDIHIPNHSSRNILATINYGRKFKPTHIIFNGDMIEGGSVSHYRKKPGLFMENEIVPVRQFIQYIYHNFPNAKLIYKIGNHELRLTHYLMENAQALFGLSNLSWESLFESDKYKMDIVESNQFILYNNIYILHGNEVKISGLDLCKKMSKKLPYKNIIFSHFHQIDYFRYADEDNTIYNLYCTGALCNLSPDWLRYNNWVNGFATIDGDVVNNYKLINEKIF